MSYTYTYGQPQGIARLFTNKLREALIAEIIAINGYTEHIANSNMQEINAALKSIMSDEKKHYSIFLTLLRKYDPDQYKNYLEFEKVGIGPRQPLQIYVPNYDKQIILNNIREDIKGEFEAVILYEDLAALVPIHDIRDAFLTISNDEKGHAEHLTELILKYDTDKYGYLNKK